MENLNKYIIGIDEAGMGPVFGPLVVSGVVIRHSDMEALREMGVKDSKKFGSGLKAHRRRLDTWESASRHVVNEKQVIIEASDLDKYNMYDLHIEATRTILESLFWKDIDLIYIEQLGQLGKEKFSAKLGIKNIEFIYETKADERYVPVSLASIKAKIVRDEMVTELCRESDVEYISGYANYKTENFLREYYSKHGYLPRGTRVSRNWDPIIEMRSG